MIFNISVLNGFTSLLGPFPLVLSMIVTLWATIDIPKTESGEIDPDAKGVHKLMLTTHILIFITLFSQIYGDRGM